MSLTWCFPLLLIPIPSFPVQFKCLQSLLLWAWFFTIIHTLTFLSNFMLSIQADFTLGTKEYWVSLKYRFNKSGHTLRIFTMRSATISSSVAVFKPSRKCRSTTFPPLLKTKKIILNKKSLFWYFIWDVNSAAPLTVNWRQDLSSSWYNFWVYTQRSKNWIYLHVFCMTVITLNTTYFRADTVTSEVSFASSKKSRYDPSYPVTYLPEVPRLGS